MEKFRGLEIKSPLRGKEHMNRDKIELSIVVANTPIKEYGNKGDTYVEGRIGTEYVLRVRNHYSHRILVVPSIDGMNTLNGKPSEYNYEGYVVPAYGSVTIDGWRTSLSQVAKFIFDEKKQSYTAKSGNGDSNCGVIGIQVYGEKIPEQTVVHWYHSRPTYVYPRYDWTYDYWNTPYCGSNNIDVGMYNYTFTSVLQDDQSLQSSMLRASSSSNTTYSSSLGSDGIKGSLCGVENKVSNDNVARSCFLNQVSPVDDTPHQVGTGWGEAKESTVTQTTFTKGDLLQTLEIFYANCRGLESLGIDLSKSNKVAFTKPQAFGGFCQAPKY